MHLVQLLLPVVDDEGRRFPRAHFDALSSELTKTFGGLTAYTRAPATGLWEPAEGETVRDDVVVYEVMVDDLDRSWWAELRQRLQLLFDQRELVIRAHRIERL